MIEVYVENPVDCIGMTWRALTTVPLLLLCAVVTVYSLAQVSTASTKWIIILTALILQILLILFESRKLIRARRHDGP